MFSLLYGGGAIKHLGDCKESPDPKTSEAAAETSIRRFAYICKLTNLIIRH